LPTLVFSLAGSFSCLFLLLFLGALYVAWVLFYVGLFSVRTFFFFRVGVSEVARDVVCGGGGRHSQACQLGTKLHSAKDFWEKEKGKRNGITWMIRQGGFFFVCCC
jgi:hypothetical protein